MKKALTYLLFLGLFAGLGFSRDFIFVGINTQLYKLYYGHAEITIPRVLHIITTVDYTTLYYSKYALTLAYLLLYFLVTFLCIRALCADKKFSRWAVYIYALLLILSVIIMVSGYVINKRLDSEEYTFSRWLMGIAQSPLVAFFLVASSTLYQSFQNKHPQ